MNAGDASGVRSHAYTGDGFGKGAIMNMAVEQDVLLRALLARVARGEKAALELLYELTVAQVWGLACRLRPDRPGAEAVTEEVYVQVWQRAPAGTPADEPVLDWLLALARLTRP